MHRVAVIGSGFISDIHLSILTKMKNIQVVSICDIDLNKAEKSAKKYNIPHYCNNIDELVSDDSIDCAHVLVPPDFHQEVANKLLENGINVFLEKPMAVTVKQCKELEAVSKNKHSLLSINHSHAFHPALLRALDILSSGKLGKVCHVQYRWITPLRQLAAKQVGHWMFRAPGNILLEQAVHPLAQIHSILGDLELIGAVSTDGVEISPGSTFYPTWHLSLRGEYGTAQLLFSVGKNFQSLGMEIVCEDGQISLDFVDNICIYERKTKWPDFFNSFQVVFSKTFQLCCQNIKNLYDFGFSTIGLTESKDTFYLSMMKSIHEFYQKDQREIATPEVGRMIVEICEKAAANIEVMPQRQIALRQYKCEDKYDVLIIGGTGFIGKKVVQKYIESGKQILVAARNIKMLDEIFFNHRVSVVQVDISDKARIESIISGIPTVINLAHGGNFNSREEASETCILGTKNIADACIKHDVKKLIHIGTIASLYLGDGKTTIYGSTIADPKIDKRPTYSWAKEKCDSLLIEYSEIKKMPVCILRPGLVIGQDGEPFHSGLGLFNNTAFCVGWNKGRNPLPFVLVDDVADAIIKADESWQGVQGKTYNIVGDIRLTGQEYIDQLSVSLGRNLTYLPQSIYKSQCVEIFKWVIKIFFQKRKVGFPSFRDLKSRGLVAQFDCLDFKNDASWSPVSDKDEFIKKGISVYGEKNIG